MAFELHDGAKLPGINVATPGVLPNRAVAFGATGSQARGIVPVASLNIRPEGVSHPNTPASGASIGQAVGVLGRGNFVKIAAAATFLTPGVDIGVASTNGAIGPVASVAGGWVLGVAVTGPANPGEAFTLFVDPRKF